MFLPSNRVTGVFTANSVLLLFYEIQLVLVTIGFQVFQACPLVFCGLLHSIRQLGAFFNIRNAKINPLRWRLGFDYFLAMFSCTACLFFVPQFLHL